MVSDLAHLRRLRCLYRGERRPEHRQRLNRSCRADEQAGGIMPPAFICGIKHTPLFCHDLQYTVILSKLPGQTGSIMSYEIVYDHEQGFLDVRLSGTFTLAEFTRSLEEITHAADYPPDVPVLWDLEKLDINDLDVQHFEKQTIMIRQQFPQRGSAKIALYAPTSLIFGLSRMYEGLSYSLPQKIMVFKNRDEAESWLQEKGRPTG